MAVMDLGIRFREQSGHRLRRSTALAAGVLALVVALELGTAPTVERYDVALVGPVCLGMLLAAGRLWDRRGFESRLIVGVLAFVALVGQLLASGVGNPGAGTAHWHPTAVVVVVLAAVVLVLGAMDLAAPHASPEDDHPYAL